MAKELESSGLIRKITLFGSKSRSFTGVLKEGICIMVLVTILGLLSLRPVLAESVTYSTHIRPLLQRYCVSCHNKQGIGDFPLTSYSEAARRADDLAVETGRRTMPPFLAKGDGTCQKFNDSQWLTDQEIALFEEWADQGAPEGMPLEALSVEKPTSLVRVDRTLSLREPFIPRPESGKDDEYRCFVLDRLSTEAQFVTAHQVRPGNSKIVHHVIAYAPMTRADEEAAIRLDRQDEREGYSCFGGVGVNAYGVVGWAPGTGATYFPENSGIYVPAGRRMVVQIHYHVHEEQKGMSDQTAIDFTLQPRVANPALVFFIGSAEGDVLPAGQAEVVKTFTFRMPNSFQILGAFPHMHTLGRRITYQLLRDGEGPACGMEVPRWDFDWQRFYFYREPIQVRAGDSLSVTCKYDTREARRDVHFGEGTEDEMCLMALYAI